MLQLMNSETSGVDNEVSRSFYLTNRRTLPFDDILKPHRAVTQRVLAPCCLVTSDEFTGRCLEEHNSHAVTLRTQCLNCPKNAGLLPSISHHQTQFVNFTTGFARQFNDLVDKHNWQIVDDEPSHVF